MSTLAEIEAALQKLPRAQMEQLRALLEERLRQPVTKADLEDPVEKFIGAFAGPKDATGRKAEDILYGTTG
jgi:hypothetical protein